VNARRRRREKALLSASVSTSSLPRWIQTVTCSATRSLKLTVAAGVPSRHGDAQAGEKSAVTCVA